MAKKAKSPNNTIAENRKARYNYEILDEWEAGICLEGSEVKSLRAGKANIGDAYASEEGGEIFLINMDIAPYGKAGARNHERRRPRKLLLHGREIRKIIGKLHNQGLTLIPLSIYFNQRGIAKVKLALGKGKAKYDKRETEKKREWDRQKARVLREK